MHENVRLQARVSEQKHSTTDWSRVLVYPNAREVVG